MQQRRRSEDQGRATMTAEPARFERHRQVAQDEEVKLHLMQRTSQRVHWMLSDCACRPDLVELHTSDGELIEVWRHREETK